MMTFKQMAKQNKTYYRIREVSAMLDIPHSTLRFWEDAFPQLEPDRTPKGQRRYKPEDVEICKLIKHLLRDKGLSLEYAKKAMEAYRKCAPRNAFVCKSPEDAINLLADARKMAQSEHAEARIEAVMGWIAGIEIVETPPMPKHKNVRGKEYYRQCLEEQNE